jgi:hypothetical protein
MIPRILVPTNIRPPDPDESAQGARRLSSVLDARTLVPADLPVFELDGRTSIPSHLPLDVLAARVLVPRDLPVRPLDLTSRIPAHVPLTVLDTRVAVPKDAALAELPVRPFLRRERLSEVLEPDVITTGEVNLLVRPVEERVSAWRFASRVSSIAFHSALLVLLLLQPKLFPTRAPTQEEIELARRQLSFIYLPPEVNDVPKVAPRAEASSPQIRVDPRVLRQIAPPSPELQPLPGPPQPERVTRDLPSAPTPQTPDSQPRGNPQREVARVNPVKPQEQAPTSGLTLPRISPGKALEESMRGAAKGGGGASTGFGGPAPPAPGGGGQGYLGGNLELLTPTEGVDFTNYLARVLASVKRNWDAVIPESARLGEKGMVVLQFRILRDGTVPYPEPVLVATSGKEPLDRAAASSIRTSNPFEPLPPAFRGPYIELRFIFLYNLRFDYQ